MRRKINPELKEYCSNNSNLTIDELLPLVNKKFKEHYTRLSLQKYLIRNKIPYKYSNFKRSNNNCYKKPIGTEYTKSDGMVLVKIAKNKWEYKQRLIYMKHYGVKLTNDDYIIFLDQDRTNFNINNLRRITRRESSILINQKIFSKKPEATELAIQIAKLMIKIKDM